VVDFVGAPGGQAVFAVRDEGEGGGAGTVNVWLGASEAVDLLTSPLQWLGLGAAEAVSVASDVSYDAVLPQQQKKEGEFGKRNRIYVPELAWGSPSTTSPNPFFPQCPRKGV
jgi:hypothetical protein